MLKFSQEFSLKSLDCWNPDSIILKIKKNLRLEEKQCAVCAASQGQAIDLLRMRYGPGPCQHRCREAQLLCPNFYIDVQGVPQLSSHFVFVILLASTHPNCKSWGSFTKFRKFATK